MVAVEQFDFFTVSIGPAERDVPGCTPEPAVTCHILDDDSLLAAIPNACIRESVALVTEAGRRRLAAAIPVLEALCRRFAGFGAGRIVPEQAAALNALVMIGGSDAAQTLVRLIARRIVQGPVCSRPSRLPRGWEPNSRSARKWSCCGMTIRRFGRMPAGALVRGPKRFPCYAIFSMTCMRKRERQPLALSAV